MFQARLYQIKIVYACSKQINYEKLISEKVAELEVVEKRQRFVRNEKRVQFLRFLKSGADAGICAKPSRCRFPPEQTPL